MTVPNAAVVLLADTETSEGMGRMTNALTTAREFREAGDEAKVIFDGAGTKWILELQNPDHKYHRLFEAVKDDIVGACAYCSRAYGVKDSVQAAGVPLLDEYDGHPSLHRFASQGYQVLTF
jgi:hypothetical protein